MTRWLLRFALGLLLVVPVSVSAQQAGLPEWLSAVETGLANVAKSAEAGDLARARSQAMQIYLDHYEVIEGWYGPGGRYASLPLSSAISSTESAFHVLLKSTSPV